MLWCFSRRNGLPDITSSEGNELYFATLAERTNGTAFVSQLFSTSPLQIASASIAILANFLGLETPAISTKIAQIHVSNAINYKKEDEMHKTGKIEYKNIFQYPFSKFHVDSKYVLDSIYNNKTYKKVYSMFSTLVQQELGIFSLLTSNPCKFWR
jgi:hypothetical protein